MSDTATSPLLATRDALADVILNNGLRSVRDASAYTSGVDESYLADTAQDIANALLASGVVRDPSTLADAWDEGFTRGFYDVLAGGSRDASESAAENPYRTEDPS